MSLLSDYGCVVVYKQNYTGDKTPLCLLDIRDIANAMANNHTFSSDCIENLSSDIVYQVTKDVLHSCLVTIDSTDRKDIGFKRIDIPVKVEGREVNPSSAVEGNPEPVNIHGHVMESLDGHKLDIGTGMSVESVDTLEEGPITAVTDEIKQPNETSLEFEVPGRDPDNDSTSTTKSQLWCEKCDYEENGLSSCKCENTNGSSPDDVIGPNAESCVVDSFDLPQHGQASIGTKPVRTRRKRKPKERILLKTCTKEEKTPCPVCDRTVSNLKDHMLAHTGQKTFLCHLCGKEYKKLASLRSHTRRHTKSHQCYVCESYFTSKHVLKVHLFTHSENKPFTCTECGKGFTRKDVYVRHMRVHTKEKPFLCPICGKSFTQKANMNTHVNRHNEAIRYQCLLCDKSFKDKYDLKLHGRKHSSENTYECSVCGKLFLTQWNMKAHEAGHAGPKLFACSACDESFVSKTEMRVHMIIHTGKKPFECSLCEKAFASQSALWLHAKKHGERNFKCSTCPKEYFYKKSLEVHMRTHTGEKPYTCTQCGEHFMCRGSFHNHKKLHEKKPYRCSKCGRHFAEDTGLQTHLRTHQLTSQ